MPKPDTNEAVAIASALRPTVDEWERESSRSCVRMKKMTVASKYDTSTRTMGVREAFSATAQNIPCVPGMRGAGVGDPVWVQWLYGDKSTMCVVGPGDVSDYYDGGVNPNILDNWYWQGGGSQSADRLPINQRGNATYSVSGYTIDRWRSTATDLKVTVSSEYVQLQNTGTSNRYLYQRFPLNEPLPFWKYVTGSILLEDHTLVSGTAHPNNTAQTSNYQTWYFSTNLSWGRFFIEIPPSGNNYYQFAIRVDAGKTVKIRAVKMEISEHQTLAYYDKVNNQWKPREIPNYDDQLIRCMYYYQNLGQYYTNGYLTSSNTQYIMPIYLAAPIHRSATATAGNVTARKAAGGYSVVYPLAGGSMQSMAITRRNPSHYTITDTRSSATSDTNNSTFAFIISNLVFKYDL